MIANPPIVVGVDGSPSSTGAVRWAAETAALHHAPLVLLSAVTVPVSSTMFGPPQSYFDKQEAEGARRLAEATRVAHDTAPGGKLSVSSALAPGRAVGALIDHSRDARMVVCGSRGLGEVTGGLLGSVTSALAHHAHSPVVVIREWPRPTDPTAMGNVVVGVDGSANSEPAIAVAFEEASTHLVPSGVDDEVVLMLADILPTSYEVGVVNGTVRPGDTVVIVGAGPIGLAAILCARLYSARHIVAIDLVDKRLEAAKKFGADVTVNPSREDAAKRIASLTDGLGADVTIEAVGVPDTFEMCTALVRAGGHVANVGVHGMPVALHLEELWTRDVTITTGLVDTWSTPTLLKLVASGQLEAQMFITHRFALSEILEAYDVFSRASETGALKVLLHK